MKITQQDLTTLRMPLIVFGIVLALSSAAVYGTRSKLLLADKELANQQGALVQAQNRYRKSGEEKDIIIQHLPAYRKLEQQGFIGAEQRINWLDALRMTNQELKMFGVEYQIAAQQAFPPGQGMDAGQFQLHQSPMKLSFRLLHEGDLMRFFDTLTQFRAGIFTLQTCTLQRIGNSTFNFRFQPALQADCQLNWITITPQAGSERNS